MTQKIYHIIKFKKIYHHQNFFLLKNIFKVTLRYLFNVFILSNIVSYLKLTLNYKYTQKCVLLKTWKKFKNPGKIFVKTSGNPELIILVIKMTVKQGTINRKLDSPGVPRWPHKRGRMGEGSLVQADRRRNLRVLDWSRRE